MTTSFRLPAVGRSASLLAVCALCLAFVWSVWPRLDLAYGDSHDGRNAAVWMTGGRAIVEDGPISTRLGASPGVWDTYAHHPPGIYLEAAAAYAVGDGSRFVARLPALLSSVAAIGLIWVWLRTLGRSRAACFVGLVCMVISPMFLLYGAMLNHEAVALPWACGSLILLARAQRGDRVHPVFAGAVAGVCALLAWQGFLLVALAGCTLAVPHWQPTTHAGKRAVSFVAGGAAVGLALTLAFQLWAYGGLGEVIDTFRDRAGNGTDSEYGFAEAQLRFAHRGVAAWVLLLAAYGTVIVLRNPRTRPAVLPLYGAVVLYALVFRDGAAVHAYWNMWGVVIVAVAVSAVVDRHRPARVLPQRVVLAAAVVLLVAYAVVLDTRGAATVVVGARAGDVIAATHIPPEQQEIAVFPVLDESSFWITYETRLPFSIIGEAPQLASLAAREPNSVVLVNRRQLERVAPGAFGKLGPVALQLLDPYATVRAEDLAEVVGATLGGG